MGFDIEDRLMRDVSRTLGTQKQWSERGQAGSTWSADKVPERPSVEGRGSVHHRAS